MTFFFAGLALILTGGVPAVAGRRYAFGDRAFGVLVVAGSGLALVPALRVLAGGSSPAIAFRAAVPGGPWVFGIDPLSAFFLIVILVVGAAAAIYGTGYLAGERGQRAVGAAHGVLALLIVTLALVVTARAVIPFLVAWEGISVTAYLLVVFDHTRPEVRRAGLVYLVATHTGMLTLFLLFLVWGHAASDLTFSALAASAGRLPAGGALIFALALLCFGMKAGCVPLHFWLPGAHGAAPSHVSAVMSGVLIKMGIYGLLRILDLMGTAPAWWGWTVLSLGLASGVLGVVWALAQHDLKRLLAYHSVENIGIILIGVGLGALGMAYHEPVIATIGFAGAILHTLNHGLFKSLLFLGAGSVQHATGIRVIDRLGGIARRLPWTWLAFLIGAAAIAGLPPLNGFVSEWVVFQALLKSGFTHGALRLAALGAAGLALIGALALACFAKVAGVVFLGHPRSAEAQASHGEAGPVLIGPMLVLTGSCVLIGMQPLLVVGPALHAGALLAGLGDAGGALAPVVDATRWVGRMAITLVVLAGAVAGIALWRRRRLPLAHADTWGCGYARVERRAQYTASSFADPLLNTFAPIANLQQHRAAGSFHSEAVDPVLEGALIPLWQRLQAFAGLVRPARQGRLHIAVLYVVATVLVLLLYLGTVGRAS
jgi:hydrogenase-4 component B